MQVFAQQPRQLSQAPNTATVERQSDAASRTGSAAPAPDTVTLSAGFRTGRDNIHSLGVMALGGRDQLQAWSEKGLIVDDATITRAFEAWNQGFEEAMQKEGKPSLAINRYALVIDSQSVPEWFQQERALNLAAISDPKIKASFESGAYYHVSEASAQPNARVVDVYRQVAQG